MGDMIRLTVSQDIAQSNATTHSSKDERSSRGPLVTAILRLFVRGNEDGLENALYSHGGGWQVVLEPERETLGSQGPGHIIKVAVAAATRPKESVAKR